MANPGELLSGRYRILRRLGAGGTATVDQARDERLDRQVAIKILLPNLAGDPATATRFEREARALAAGSHPGVVAVYDVDPGDPASGHEPFFVMELCSGGSLADRLAGGRRMSPDDLIPILVSVTDGLADLHGRGIVHRDVKPQNILFAADRAKLADFGLAQASSPSGPSDLTGPGTAVGTLAYLAPEILAGQRASTASDVYSLGVVAFVALTGGWPRPAGSIAEVVSAAPLPARRVSDAAPELGTAFDESIAAAMAPQPEGRPDALQLGSGLTGALGRWSRDGGRERSRSADVPASAIASAIPAGDPPPDDEALTSLDIAVPETAPMRASSPFATGVGAAAVTAPRQRSIGWLLPAAAVLGIVAAVLAIASGLAGLGDASSTPSAAPSAVNPSPSPSPSVVVSASPSATASPSPAPSPSPSLDPAFAAIDAVDAAISAARGGPGGLKGKDANELEALAGAVRRDLSANDRTRALDDARKLDQKARALSDHMSSDSAARLTDATGALVRTLGG